MVAAILIPSSAPAQNQLQICQLNDIDVGTWTGSGDIVGHDMVSIYNKDSSNYYISADTGAGDYSASDGTHNIGFEVKWNDGGGDVDMPHHTAIPASGARSDACGTTNATVKVKFTSTTLGSAYAGTYSAQLNLTLTTR